MRRWLATGSLALAVLLVSGPAFAQDESGEAAEEESSAEESSSEEGGDAAMIGSAPSEKEDEGMSSTSTTGSIETDTGGGTVAGSSGHASVDNMFVVGPHAGLTFPAFSDLGLWGIFGLEIGFQPPMMDDNPLEIALMGRYTQPGASDSGTDDNLGRGGAEYNWDLTQQTITLDLVGIWRFRNVVDSLHVYPMAGPRMNLMRTKMEADGNGNDFGEVEETNTEFGFVVGGGVDYELGPGTLFGELKFEWTNLKQHLTGNTNTGSFVLDVGYRFYPF